MAFCRSGCDVVAMDHAGMQAQRGLTLLECLMAVAIVALLSVMSVPTFRDQLAAARARAGAHQLYSMVQTARSTALLSGEDSLLCPSQHVEAEQPTCEGHFGGSVGLMNPAGLSATLHRVWSSLEGVTVRNRAGTAVVGGTLRWDRYGFGNRNVTLSVCSGGHNWSVVVNRLGRPRLARQWGACP
jgi:type IV fimbrial biogenesis protein FimT